MVNIDLKLKKIDEKKFSRMLLYLRYKMQYLNIDGSDIERIDHDYNILKKTVYSDKINETARLMSSSYFEEKDIIALLIGTGYGIQLEICEILSMLKAINNNISSLATAKSIKDNLKANNLILKPLSKMKKFN